MPDPPTIPAFNIHGQVGGEWVFGHNLYGPWIAPKTWTPENHTGMGGETAFYISELAAIWSDMTTEAKSTWNAPAKKIKITAYNLYLKINIERLRHGRDSIQTYAEEP